MTVGLVAVLRRRACAAAGCDPVVCAGRGVPSNDVLFDRSTAAIPGGVNSSIRAFKAVGGRPVRRRPGRGPVRVGRRGHAATSTSCRATAR